MRISLIRIFAYTVIAVAVLMTFLMIIFSATGKEVPCDMYSNASLRDLPARCYHFYGIEGGMSIGDST